MTDKQFLNQIEVSKRWSISPRTLERWRWLGTGPCFVKIGGLVRYKLEDVKQYENDHILSSTSEAFISAKQIKSRGSI
ncbi:hypothetical protein I862_04385 [endosymbiont of Acanthamoeba sp. UWC8]|uniref:helix-turn-helix transcriptional regulator n=1 Tax=endosymbiont of Acanthamoeba sp. UWC8 TaxID=86106 RepID=UPI0004D11C6B|nr:helix-turn-helix domain-containing protein [endosymbiont of Acanthamoeba sp. UWC8]AIF81437.1 hypothetical protein I862_04385 [endosymbiont of Acanthamoeba sp. UWC8]